MKRFRRNTSLGGGIFCSEEEDGKDEDFDEVKINRSFPRLILCPKQVRVAEIFI